MAEKSGQKQTESNSQKAGKLRFVAESGQMLGFSSQENHFSQACVIKKDQFLYLCLTAAGNQTCWGGGKVEGPKDNMLCFSLLVFFYLTYKERWPFCCILHKLNADRALAMRVGIFAF